MTLVVHFIAAGIEMHFNPVTDFMDDFKEGSVGYQKGSSSFSLFWLSP